MANAPEPRGMRERDILTAAPHQLCGRATSRPAFTFEEAPTELVEDLLRLIAVVPFDQLIDPTVMLLNLNFGTASESVGGADADLISGRTLVDFKTTKNAELKAEHLDQLFGYFLLARRSKTAEISRAGVYFSRHGHLWTHDTTQWTTHPGFGETEQWFFDKAQEG